MAQSAEFTQIFIGDNAGTLIDISTYATITAAPLEADITDLTAFTSGGGQNTKNSKRGAGKADVSLTVLCDPVMWALATQLDGNRTGTTLQIKTGNNAPPQQGDPMFTGTYTLFGGVIDSTTGKARTMTWLLKPSVNGAITPKFTRI